MVQLYTDKGAAVGPLEHANELHIQEVLEYGDSTLYFKYPKSGPYRDSIKPEAYARTENQEYVIKETSEDMDDHQVSVTAQLNIEGLVSKQFVGGFQTIEKTATECLNIALSGTGWKLKPCKITKRRTIRIEQDCSAWDVVKRVKSNYRGEVNVFSLTREIELLEKVGADKGVYFVEGLNLRKLGVTTSTYGFFTRLIPVGKDGLQLWMNGQNYVENHQYSDKVITAIWRDERYTNTTSLYEDAVAKLEEGSRPVVAYAADVRDLATQSEEYSILDYSKGDTVLLASQSTGVMERQRIVVIDRWPDAPEKNTAELSNVTQTFAELQKTEAEATKQEAIDISQRLTSETLSEGYLTKVETETAIRAMGDSIELYVAETYYNKNETTNIISSSMQQTKDAINMTFINGKLSANTQFNINGMEIRKGGIQIFNNADDLTFFSDTSGNTYCARLGNYLYKDYYALIGVSGDNLPGIFGYYTKDSSIVPNVSITPTVKNAAGKFGTSITAKNRLQLNMEETPDTYLLLNSDQAYLRRDDSILSLQADRSVLKKGNTSIVARDEESFVQTSADEYLLLNSSGAYLRAQSNTLGLSGDRTSISGAYSCVVAAEGTNVVNFEKGKLSVYGALACTGAKNRIVSTPSHGAVLMNTYETAGCWFGDIGEGEIGEDGVCVIALDDVFMETLAERAKYQVFIQPYGKGEACVSRRDPGWFVVEGPPGLQFAWEIKGVQRGYEFERTNQSSIPADRYTEPLQLEPSDQQEQFELNKYEIQDIISSLENIGLDD